MTNRRSYQRIKCRTPVCWNQGKLNFIGTWESNEYCDYIRVLCPVCHAKYWMVKRDGKYALKTRDNEDFEHRKSGR